METITINGKVFVEAETAIATATAAGSYGSV